MFSVTLPLASKLTAFMANNGSDTAISFSTSIFREESQEIAQLPDVGRICSEIAVLLCKLCVLCCRSPKAGSFLIFMCLDLLSLENLHKSQKAFTKLGRIEVAALFGFCIILTM